MKRFNRETFKFYWIEVPRGKIPEPIIQVKTLMGTLDLVCDQVNFKEK